jgi:Mrp family chromosome partitioning ATPase
MSETLKQAFPRTAPMKSKTAKTAPQNGVSAIEQQMESLFATLLPAIDEQKSLIVHLVAATPGEGVSTLARALAVAAGRRSWCKVALLELVAEGTSRATVPEGPTLLDQFARDGTAIFEPISIAGATLSMGELSDTGAARPRLDTLRDFYTWARARFTLVIVDCPPIMRSPDSAVLCGLADGTILVVEADRTRVPVVQRARETLLSGGAKILGVVLNKREDLIPSFLYRFI